DPGLRAEWAADRATERRAAATDCAGLVWHREREVAQADRGPQPPLHGALHGARLRDRARRAEWRPSRVRRKLGDADESQVNDCSRHAASDKRRASTAESLWRGLG